MERRAAATAVKARGLATLAPDFWEDFPPLPPVEMGL